MKSILGFLIVLSCGSVWFFALLLAILFQTLEDARYSSSHA